MRYWFLASHPYSHLWTGNLSECEQIMTQRTAAKPKHQPQSDSPVLIIPADMCSAYFSHCFPFRNHLNKNWELWVCFWFPPSLSEAVGFHQMNHKGAFNLGLYYHTHMHLHTLTNSTQTGTLLQLNNVHGNLDMPQTAPKT